MEYYSEIKQNVELHTRTLEFSRTHKGEGVRLNWGWGGLWGLGCSCLDRCFSTAGPQTGWNLMVSRVRPRNLYFDKHVFLLNFIEAYLTHDILYPFQMYNTMIFRNCTYLCHHHHKLVLEHFYYPNQIPHSLLLLIPIPTPCLRQSWFYCLSPLICLFSQSI